MGPCAASLARPLQTAHTSTARRATTSPARADLCRVSVGCVQREPKLGGTWLPGRIEDQDQSGRPRFAARARAFARLARPSTRAQTRAHVCTEHNHLCGRQIVTYPASHALIPEFYNHNIATDATAFSYPNLLSSIAYSSSLTCQTPVSNHPRLHHATVPTRT